ncbi:hypothetical protein PVAND_006530 [Polypedilum vanderplanki]|uniref:Peptidoglycan recognition protein family domain-containing protein n=1 Tax=Polypedilum vanderplanki TaxID=319348 RepID=A0A9J6C561_POLVA|nr:hypothetical protein PVAND_006530 [Polypedilum vanderplanki]
MDKNNLVHNNSLNSRKYFQGINRKRNILITIFSVAFILVILTTVSILYFVLKTDSNSDDFKFENLISRDEWNAAPPKSGIPFLESPIKRIIIAHTAGEFCDNENECKFVVKRIQNENSHLDDIPYNFLIGNDGKVYEGRGFEKEGQHTSNLYGSNYNSIDFIILSQDSLVFNNIKSDALNEAVSKLKNFYPLQKVYRREEWGAANPKEAHTKFSQKKEIALLSHSVTQTCSSFSHCATIMKNIQRNHMGNNGWIDFAFNFAVGANGLIFECRGFDFVGAHFSALNSRSIGILAIGEFNEDEPSQEMLDTLEKFLEDAAKLGKLSEDFKIHGRQDFGSSGPGENIMKHIREWCRYGNRTTPC